MSGTDEQRAAAEAVRSAAMALALEMSRASQQGLTSEIDFPPVRNPGRPDTFTARTEIRAITRL